MTGDGGSAVQTWASPEAVAQWQQGAGRRAQVLGPATEELFKAAGLEPGMHVLDLAAGSGDQSIMAAKLLGPSGSILAVDISASMLAAAERAAREAGVEHFATLAADIANLELDADSFDAAICRLGLMFLPDVRLGLERVRRALKPGGRLAALVWSSEASNPYMGTAVGVVRDMGRIPQPPPTILRAMSLSRPGVLEDAFSEAGFRDVQVRTLAIVREFESVDETLHLLQTGGSAQTELMRELSDSERAAAWSEVARRLQPFVQSDGRVRIPGEVLLVAGTKM